MQHRRGPTLSGFTIVELLIVVVVIGVLSAVILVGYSNVQSSAYNSVTVSNAGEYQKALNIYLSQNGDYPYFDRSVGGVCLGTGYKDIVGNDGIGDCGEKDYYLSENTQFNTNLQKTATGLKAVNTRVVNMPYQSDTWVGASFHYYPPFPVGAPQSTPQTKDGFTLNGRSNPYYIMFVLEKGYSKCGLRVIVPDDAQGGWPRMKDAPPGQTYSWTDGKTTACVASMQSPGD